MITAADVVGGGPVNAFYRGSLGRALRRLHPSGRYAAIALALLLAVLLVVPPELRAQGHGPLTASPMAPNLPDGAMPSTPARPSGPVQVMIELDDEPAVVTAARAGGPAGLAASASRSQVATIDRAQQSVLRSIQSGGVTVRVLYRVQKAFNGIAAVVDAGQIDRIRAEPGVRDVQPIVLLDRTNSSTVPLINAPAVWTSLGLTGQGIKIGIIDTGIDYLHRNFGGPGTYAGNNPTTIGDTPGFFPNGPAVAGGFDFAGDNYDARSSDPAKNVPQPDPDPMDCAVAQGGGHGSHVAGTAAGRGVKVDNTTFPGPYNTSVPFATLKIGPGAAPAARLYALKVFGCTGSTALAVQAIDWALDPNDDADLSDRLDVINMSLGSDFGLPEDPTVAASNNAALAGLIVVAAAGNGRDNTAISGTPASATRAISVASSDDSTAILDGFAVLAPAGITGAYAANASSSFNWAAMTSPVSAVVVYPSANRSGCSAFTGQDAIDAVNRIVLLDWIPSGQSSSPCGSATRVENAAAVAARGVILVYNQAILDVNIAGASSIPAVITNSTTGDRLKANIASLQATLDKQYLRSQRVVDASQEDRIASFSSRGPSTRTGALKPDLTAPGVTIFSTASGSGSEGESLSGTSMSSPLVAGLLSILRQQHPTWTVEELKALAMNTANHDIFTGTSHSGFKHGTSRVGAGRVDASTATTSSSVAFATDDPGGVNVSFGAVESLGTTSQTRTIRVVNKGAGSLNYTVGYTPTTAVPGTSISFPDGTSFNNVPSGGSRTFRVQLNMTAPQLKNPLDPTMAATQAALNPRHYLAEVTGIVSVTPSSGPALRVPLHAAVRPASDMHATQTSFVVTSPNQTFTLGLTGTGVDNGASPPVDVRSLVSVFELQSVSPAQPPTASPEARAADLRYVGVSSSGRLNQVANTSFLYFGLASERNWLRPSSEVIFSVLIDNNRDGTFESELYNGHLVTGADEDTDVFVTKLFNIGAGVTTIPTYLNVLQATIPSAIFDSNVLVMGVRADQLGLSTTNSRFNYKVNVWYRGSIRDSTPTLTYDWLRPGADIFSPTVPAVIYNDLPGNTTSITFNQTSYQQNNSLGLLLLHHYNRDGQRAEVVNIGQAQTVSFAAGSPTSKLVTDPPFAVSATASSGLPVTIASQTPAVCTINGSNVVALVTGGTCTLRAAQAGNSTFLPASTDLTITVLGPCSPRPRVGLSTSRLPNGSLQVTVTAGSGSIQSVRFATDTRPLVNATVQIQTPSGTQVITTGTTVTMPPNTTSKTFTATRNAAGAMTVPMIVTDGCGVWQTFVGMGTGV